MKITLPDYEHLEDPMQLRVLLDLVQDDPYFCGLDYYSNTVAILRQLHKVTELTSEERKLLKECEELVEHD